VERLEELTQPAKIVERRFIVGTRMSDRFEDVPKQETIALLELTK
jgi:hypothetical protein